MRCNCKCHRYAPQFPCDICLVLHAWAARDPAWAEGLEELELDMLAAALAANADDLRYFDWGEG